MGAAENRAKSAAQAAYMKERGIMRKTGQCPWGCGSKIVNGGPALLTHLGRCQGGGAKKHNRVLAQRGQR
jgi:hypothetical protein